MDRQFDESTAWYAVCVRARQEATVAAALTAKGFHVLLPQYCARRRWSDRVKVLTLALFPGYVFVRFDIRARLALLKTEGVIHIVGAGDVFLPVEPHEIGAIQQMVTTGLDLEPWPYTAIGRQVRIEAGPLRGVEGLLAGVENDRRLVVSVSLLQRSVAVRLAAADVVPSDPSEVIEHVHLWEPASVGA
jgi:transcription antitermination factor NusG